MLKLKKVIYGLKQAHRAGYHELNFFFLLSGFKNSYAEASLFVFNIDGHILCLIFYVDDMGNNSGMVD